MDHDGMMPARGQPPASIAGRARTAGALAARVPRAVLLLLPMLALISGIVVVTAARGEQSTVYSVPAVTSGLEREPQAWLGRAIAVRGRIPLDRPSYGCAGDSSSCRATAIYDLYPAPADLAGADAFLAQALLLAPGQPDPLRAQLRRVPLLGSLMGGPQTLRGAAVAVYRVRLERAPRPAPWCQGTNCYLAVLLDTGSFAPADQAP